MEGLVVVTHNGKLPAEGGIRLGFLGGNRYFDLHGPATGVVLTPPKPVEPPKPKLTAARRNVTWGFARCPFCMLETHDNMPLGPTTCRACDMKFEIVNL
jgi:hypothetical protein